MQSTRGPLSKYKDVNMYDQIYTYIMNCWGKACGGLGFVAFMSEGLVVKNMPSMSLRFIQRNLIALDWFKYTITYEGWIN